MKPRLLIVVAITAVLHAVIAFGLYRASVVAEATGHPIFRYSVKALIFSDVPVYRAFANRTFAGEIPYRDFPVEYPPLSLPVFYLPRALTARPMRYVLLFAVEMLVFHALTVLTIARRVDRIEGERAVLPRLIWLTAAFVGVAPFVMGRFDSFPALVALWSACALYSGRSALGGFLSAIGALIKLVPGATIIPSLVDLVSRPFESRNGRAPIAFLATMLVGVFAWFRLAGLGALASIRYHSERGIEIGSIYAGFLTLLGKLAGWEVLRVDRHSSSTILAPGAELAGRLAMPIQLMSLILVGWAFARNGRRDPFRYAGAALVGFSISGKVLSPQYLIWILPFAALLTGSGARLGRALFLVASLLTLFLYPWNFHALALLLTWPLVVLNVRNVLLIALFVVMIWGTADAETVPA